MDEPSFMKALFHGVVTEELIFGDVSTGAQNDLMRATDIARAMVKEYGMSGKMGLITYERPRNPFLTGDNWTSTEKEYSEKIAAEIDEEVKRILDETHQKTRNLIQDKRETLDSLANLLIEKEVVDREEFKKLLQLTT